MGTSLAVMRDQLETLKKANFGGALVTVDAGHFMACAYTLLSKNPDLCKKCSKESLTLAIMSAATLDVPLVPSLGWATIIPYGSEAQLSIGYQIYTQKAKQSKLVKDCYAEVVREGDRFKRAGGLHRNIIHEYAEDGERGKIIGVYAVIVWKSGGFDYIYLAINEVYEKHRSKSKAYQDAVKKNRTDTPWIEYEESMVLKTAIRKLFQTGNIPISETERVKEVDNLVSKGKNAKYQDGMVMEADATVEVTPESNNGQFNEKKEEKKSEPPTQELSYFEKVLHHIDLHITEINNQGKFDPKVTKESIVALVGQVAVENLMIPGNDEERKDFINVIVRGVKCAQKNNE